MIEARSAPHEARPRPNPTLSAALKYASRGWFVFPCHSMRGPSCSCGHSECDSAAKHPRTKRGLSEASTDLNIIRAWWTRWPDANIAIATGAASGFDVLDVDPRHLGDVSLAELVREHEALPHTPEAKTGGGGRHILFAHPGEHVGNKTGIRPGLDVRGDGGYIIAPPSNHTSGLPYAWEGGALPSETPFAPFPLWLLTLVRGTNGKTAEPQAHLDAADVLAGVPEGERDDKLFRFACKLRRHGLPKEMARALVLHAADKAIPPFSHARANEKVDRVWNKYQASASDPLPEGAGEDDTEAIPVLPEICWRTGFKEFREAYTGSTEASDAFLWGGYFVVAGLVLGRSAQLLAGSPIFPNVFLTIVGASGRSRKSTAQAFARRLLEQTDSNVETSQGIGSPEGLIQLLAGRPNTRLLIDLAETSILFSKGAQEGTRGLLPLVTALYDCPKTARLPNRKEDLKATDPFLGILGSTTAEWLRRDLHLDDLRGGLAGRFCYIVGKEKAPIAFPPPPDTSALRRAETILRNAGNRHTAPLEYGLSPEASTVWKDWYTADRAKSCETSILEVLTHRLHPHAWKLALLYAALEGTTDITVEQITAACAFADYQREAQKHVFLGFGDSETMKTEQRILAALKKHGPLGGWQITQRVRHTSAENLGRGLRNLARLEAIEERKQGRRTIWSLTPGQGWQGFGKVSGKGGLL